MAKLVKLHPVPEALRRIREARGFDLASAAEHSKISSLLLENLEAESGEIPRGALERLANTYSVPIAYFYSSDIEFHERLPDFRTVRNKPAIVSARGFERINRAEYLQRLISSVEICDVPLLRETKLLDDLTDFAGGVAKLREHISLPLPTVFSSRRPDQAFREVRLQIEKSGVPVIADRILDEAYRGFCLAGNEKVAPLIFINTFGQRAGTKLFTLVHEFVHVFLGAAGVSDPFIIGNRTERFCNRVAAEFLMPQDRFTEIYRALGGETVESAREIVDAVSEKFGTSKQATALRIDELRLRGEGFYGAWQALYPQGYRTDFDDETFLDLEIEDEDDLDDGGSPTRGGGPFAVVIGRYGYLIPVGLTEAARAGRISPFDSFRLTNIKPPSFDYVYDTARRRLFGADE